MKITYAGRALRDLEGIAELLESRSPVGARNVLKAVKASVDALEHFPHIGQLVDDAGHRRLPVGNYRYMIYYRIAGDELLILHIRHTSRRPIEPATDL